MRDVGGRWGDLVNRRLLVRVLVVITLLTGVNYLVWRYLDSINWSSWYIAVPLVLAETYSLIDAFLFGLTMWRLKVRGRPPRPPSSARVDVFITTYNEPVEMVMATAVAARDIRYPHRTWVLDDGSRPEMREACEAAGVHYMTRGEEWADRPRHAKAGNLNNALFHTGAEFMLILDADQIPAPAILDRTLGYFNDPQVALVQAPQYFVNVDDSDPLGSQAPLFYGPIQQGKDGWNAAFFCGSNAVLRREALMQLGVVGYVRELEVAVVKALAASERMLAGARAEAQASGPSAVAALDRVGLAVREARVLLKAGEPIAEVTFHFQREVDAAARLLVEADVRMLREDLAAIEALPMAPDQQLGAVVVDEAGLQRLSQRDWSPLGALESIKALVTALDVDRSDEAQPVMPMATISVTEDMATAMRLHALGWHTVYHHEILAAGLAPEDLGTMLHQRLRWSQGTLQVMLKENPLRQKGMTIGQRLMYFATMWSYLSGFTAVVYLLAPMLYLFFGIQPVRSYGAGFILHIAPYLIATQMLFFVVGYGIRTWRGQQYSLALFPIWIRAVITAVGNVYFGRSLGFVVTPKTRQDGDGGFPWRLIRPQLATIALLVLAVIVGLVRLSLGLAPTAEGTWVNIAWVAYDLVVLSVIIEAARYRGSNVPPAGSAAPPAREV